MDANQGSFSFRRLAPLVLTASFALLALPSSGSAATCENGAGGGMTVAKASCKPVKKQATSNNGPVRKARLVAGRAIAPSSAPARVKKVIAWANKIRNKPYVYGGGHKSFNSSGYDCSGAVSYALRGGRFLSSPLASSGLMRWQRSGKGRWITVYSNPSHAYMIVAGLRFDTSMTPGNGPGWSKSLRSTSGRFVSRHPSGY